jgi:hypothetical protein
MKNLSAEEKKALFAGSDEEKAEVAKKAGISDDELDQMKQMGERMRNGGGPGGGGFGGPGGGGGGGFGGGGRPGGGGGGN